MTTHNEKRHPSNRRIIAYIFIGAFLYFVYLLSVVEFAIPMLYASVPVFVAMFGGLLWAFYKGIVELVQKRDDMPWDTHKRALTFLSGDILVLSVSVMGSFILIDLFERYVGPIDQYIPYWVFGLIGVLFLVFAYHLLKNRSEEE